MSTIVATKRLTDREKEELIKEVLGHDYTRVGKNLPILKGIIDSIGHADNAFTISQLIKYSNILIAGNRFMTVVANGASVLSIFLSPIANLITVVNAWQTGHQMYAYRAVAYTLTAWAFNRTVPIASNQMLSNIRTAGPRGGPTRDPAVVQEYEKVWRDTSRKVINRINTGPISTKVPKDALKIILRATANNNAQQLCEMILKGFEGQFSSIPKITWKSLYKIRFPG